MYRLWADETVTLTECQLMQLVAIIDIDCAVIRGFDQEDQEGLTELARLIAASCDWDI